MTVLQGTQWTAERGTTGRQSGSERRQDGSDWNSVGQSLGLEMSELINLYMLLSAIPRGMNDLHKEVTGRLLPQLHHDQPISGQYGSVRRTSRRQKSFNADEGVLDTLTEAGIEPERVLGVDRAKMSDALYVTNLSEEGASACMVTEASRDRFNVCYL